MTILLIHPLGNRTTTRRDVGGVGYLIKLALDIE